MITLLLLMVLAVLAAAQRVRAAIEAKRLADERCRESMREVAENWHFRAWERDLRSSDSV